ncbi:FliH/SctL family protein [Thalassospira sp. CH_XMU1448-2]|uniref:FliH/SctL family protein n=1 Tax=Thalassospira sp. CH_XMU1448-2 TaxID=3107773 RepID=UPI00300AF0B8
MTAIEKFTFALSFDDADNVIRSAGDSDEHYELGKKKKKKKDDTPPPPPAVYTEEQAAQMVAEAEQKAHAQGLAEGHVQGLEQGYQEVMASVEKAIGDVESVIAEKLGQIDEQQKRANAKINEDAIHVALGVIRKLAPAWSKKYNLVEIEDIVRQCLANLFDAPKVMIKVNPDLANQLADVTQRIAESRGFSGKVVVVAEPDVAVGDCAVSWGDGTAVRDSARLWSEINGIVETALALHASEHGLPKSDMGDPKVQESPAPAKPAATTQTDPTPPQPDHSRAQGAAQAPTQTAQQSAPQAAQQPSVASGPATPTTSQAPRDVVSNGVGAPQQRPAQTQQAPDAGQVQPPVQRPVQNAPTPSAGTTPPNPQQRSPAPGTVNAVGDGTDARNVQTSTNDAMPKPDNALENPANQAKASAQNTQQATGRTGDVRTDAKPQETGSAGTASPTPNAAAAGVSGQQQPATPSPGPQSASTASQGLNQQTANAANGTTAPPTDAEKMAAVKQPTKDAGDENG